MDTLVKIFGAKSYTFVSSSFLISQLTLGVLHYLEEKSYPRYTNQLKSPIFQQSIDYKNFQLALSVLNTKMMYRHFELISKILKPNGVMHLSVTMGSQILTMQDTEKSQKYPIQQIVPQKILFPNLMTFFELQQDMVSSWGYVKQAPTDSYDGERFVAISIPCKPIIDTTNRK